MHTIKKIIFLFSIALSIIIIREFISLYTDLHSINEYLGYAFILLITFLLIYFAFIPLFKIFSMPKSFSPTRNKNEIDTLMQNRIKSFERNQLLRSVDFTRPISFENKYNEVILILEEKTEQVRKKYISKVFYSTAVSQNGFLDAIIILSASINLVKEIFIIYNGRVSNKDLFTISRKIYTAIAIGGSESVEYATDEIIASMASDGLKSIPFIDKVMGSIAGGFVNAMLVTRVSYITENYCKKIYIKSEKDLLPSFKVVYGTTKLITNDVRNHIKSALKNISIGKKENFAKFAVNPAGYVIHFAMNTFNGSNSDDSKTKNVLNNAIKIGTGLGALSFTHILHLFSRKKTTVE